jgi:hypothetical protein
MLDTILTFDVEDVYFDPSEGGDDHPIWIAQTLDACGLTGTFLFVGDKVRRLKKNGRSDVVKALARHSIGMHVSSNVHPTMPEYTANMGWHEGLARVRAEEQAFATEFEEFFGRPPEATSRHSIIGATQQYPIAAEMNLPSIYGVPASVPAVADISFCCGGLNTPEGPPGFVGTGFDRSYSDDHLTEACLARIDQHVQLCRQAGKTFLNIFLGHPVMVRGVSPWFIYFLWPNGQNLSRIEADALGQAPIKAASVMPTVRRNFERVCRFIAQHPDLEVIGAAELRRRYGWHKPSLSLEDVNRYGDRFIATRKQTPTAYMGDIPLDDWFSPAEIVAALTDFILAWSAERRLPREVPRRDVLGPLEVPLICPELPQLTASQMVEAANQVRNQLDNSGYLPGNILLNGKRIGLGSYLQTASDFFRQIQSGVIPGAQELVRVACRYPAFAHEIDTAWRRMILEDGTADPEIDLELFCRYARLQSWTVKPAHRKT